MQSYRVVKAPFAGVITLRNVDVGALVNSGNTLLFRIAQTGTLRTYVNVPQTNASSIQAGQPARLTVSNLPGRELHRHRCPHRELARSQPAARCWWKSRCRMRMARCCPACMRRCDLQQRPAPNAPLLVPGDALIVARRRHAGRRGSSRLHRALPEDRSRPRLWRPAGSSAAACRKGDTIIANPGDNAREGVKVEPVDRHQRRQ